MNPDCRAFREKLSAYVEGDLEVAERDAITGHLGQCDSCAQELGALRQMLEGLKQAPPVRVPADFRQKFWAKVEGPAKKQNPLRQTLEPWYLKVPVGALAMAAVVLLAVRITRVGPLSPSNLAVTSEVNLAGKDQRRQTFPARKAERVSAGSDNFQFKSAAGRMTKMDAAVALRESDRKVSVPPVIAAAERTEAGQAASLERQMAAEAPARMTPSASVPSPVAGAVSAGSAAHRYVPQGPFPMDMMQQEMQRHDMEEVAQGKKVPLPGLRLHVRLYAQDIMAANDQVLRLLEEIPTKFVVPPLPIHYELSLRPELVETFLERLKQIGSSMDLQQESAASPESDSPAQITVDIFSARPR